MANQKKAQVVITANAAVAKKIMDELNQRIAALKQKMDALDVSTKQGQKEFNKLQKELISYNSAAVQNITNTERIDKAMKNLSKTSLADLKRALAAAKSELNKMSANDPGLKKMQSNIKAIQGQIDKVTGSTKQASNAFTSLVKHGTQMVAMYASLNAIKSAITGITEGLFKMSDELIDIRKVSGLTIQEVNKVSDAIRGVDTRTSVSDLNKLAYAGSKLGIASGHNVEALVGFTKAADQLNVALHEDLGDEAITQVAKMTQVMGDMDRMGTEQALLSTGSAIFKLASTSTSNGQNIVEFSKRLVGLGKASKMTTPEILALGSAADSMMLMPEVASTAMSKFITALQTNWNLIEKDLKMKAGSLQDIIQRKGVLPAMQVVLKQMKETGNMNALNFMFKDMGSEGARLKNVLVTMSQNYTMLNDHINTSNEAFREGVAVTREYRMQQETAAAYMERASNMWQKAFVNRENVDLAKAFAQEWYNFSKEMAGSEGFIVAARIALEGIFTVMKMLISILPNLIIGLGAAGLYGAISSIVSIGSTLISGINAVKTSWAAMNATMKASVIGAVATVVSMLTMWIIDLASATRDESNANDELKMSMSEIRSETNRAAAELETYANAIRRATNNEKERQAAIKQFNDKFGTYLQNLGLEVNSVETLEEAYIKLKDAIIGAQLAKLKQKYIDKYVTPRIEWELNALDVYGQYANNGDKGLSRDVLVGLVDDSKSADDASAILASRLGVSKERARIILESAGFNDKVSSSIRNPNPKSSPANSYYVGTNKADPTIKLSALEQQFWAGAKVINQHYSMIHHANSVEDMFAPVQEKINLYLNSTTGGGISATNAARDKAAEKAAREAAAKKKAEERAARIAQAKEDSQRKKAEREELEAAENNGKALIDNINSYYDLQQSALSRMVVNGEITASRAKQVNNNLEQKRNKMLSQAKLALSGQENMFKKLVDGDMGLGVDQLDFSNISEGILLGIQASDPASYFQIYKKYSGADAPDGINGGETVISKYKVQASEAAKAFQDLRQKIILTQQEAMRSVDELESLQYEYSDKLINMGFARGADADIFGMARDNHTGAGRQAQEWSNTMNDEAIMIDEVTSVGTKGKRKDPYSTMLETFRAQLMNAYNVNPDDISDIRDWLDDFISPEGTMSWWAKEFPQLADWKDNLFSEGVKNLLYEDPALMAKIKDAQEKVKIYSEQADKNLDDGVDWAGARDQWQEYLDGLLKDFNGNRLEMFERFKDKYADIFADMGLSDVNFEDFKKNSDDVIKYVSSLYDGELRSFFLSLMKYSEDYEDAEKKRADRLNKMAEYKWKRSSEKRSGADAVSAQESVFKNAQMRESFGAMSSIAAMDPEILLWQKRIELINAHIKSLKENGATAEKIHEEELKLVEANDSLNKSYVNKAKAQAEAIKKWMAPIEEYGSALGEAVFDESKTVKDATQDMIKSFIKLTGEYVNQKLTQWVMTKLYNSMMATSEQELVATKQEAAVTNATTSVTEAGVEVAAGNAAGAAKTVGQLGWWGIPLVTLIGAVLGGLMSLATGALSKAFGSSSSSSKTTNTKLVSGMLTYDSGNVQTYAGTDGNYYSAQSVSRLSTGIVTSPIATTVNGAPALVGERGPEIVVGRETTAAIMRNDPGLLRMLVGYDKMYSGRRRTYDEGNVSAVSLSGNTLSDTQMADIMMKLLYRLDNPIAPNINMYGRDGLHAKMQQANQFMKGK